MYSYLRPLSNITLSVNPSLPQANPSGKQLNNILKLLSKHNFFSFAFDNSDILLLKRQVLIAFLFFKLSVRPSPFTYRPGAFETKQCWK